MTEEEIKYDKTIHEDLTCLSNYIIDNPDKFLLFMKDEKGDYLDIHRDCVRINVDDRHQMLKTACLYLHYKITGQIPSRLCEPTLVECYIGEDWQIHSWSVQSIEWNTMSVQEDVIKLEEKIKKYLDNFFEIMEKEKEEKKECEVFLLKKEQAKQKRLDEAKAEKERICNKTENILTYLKERSKK